MADFVSANTGAQIDAGIAAANAALPKAGGTLTGDVTTSTALSLNAELANVDTSTVGEVASKLETDLDNHAINGWFRIASGANQPEGGSFVGMTSNFDANTAYQVASKAGAAIRLFARVKDAATFGSWGEFYHSANAASLPLATAFAPADDNVRTLGDASGRWSEVFAGNATINTSDAREKTEISPFTFDEIEASKQLANEIGTYKFLLSVETKGSSARTHIGLTVQRAIEIMTANNLEPMSYGFICFNSWDEEVEAILDSEGEAVLDADEEPTYKVIKEAGDRYGFRYDQLNQFILAGFNARLEAAGV